MSKPIRVQRKRTKGFKLPPNTVCVCRPSKFGNPFKITPERGRAAVVSAFNTWLRVEGCDAGSPERKKAILEALPQLRGKNLACYCALDQPCHADVLLELANA